MKWSNMILFLGLLIGFLSCKHNKTYPNTQSQFAYDPNYRIGKWYSVSDTSGNAILGVNSLLDTIWFMNDSIAGWTGFGGNPYSFFETYVSPKSIYDLVCIVPDNNVVGKMDTSTYQFGFKKDTMVIYWNFSSTPPQTEEYLKKR